MKLRYKYTFLFFSVFCYFLTDAPVKSQPTYFDRIDILIASYAEQGLFSGSVLVANNGEVFKKGYGLADRPWNIPNAPQTRFQIASLTKQFTAMLILQLAEQGDLSLNDPISFYLPDYPAAYGADVSIKHLLSHTSGIPSYTAFKNWPDTTSRLDTRPPEFIEYIAARELQFRPGTRFSYSNSNYYLLGIIIEKITAKSYGRVLQEQILDPAYLTNTGYRFNRMIVESMAEGYERLPTGLYEKASYQSPSTAYSVNGIYSTVEDLYKWDQLLYADRLLTQPYREQMFTAQVNNYGYGWIIGSIYADEAKQFFKSPFNYGFMDRLTYQQKYGVNWHWGSNPGFNSLLIRVPGQRWTIIILENQKLLGDPEGTKIFDIAGAIFTILDENR